MQQDFSKRLSIVVDKSLQSWQVLNTVAHISAYFGYKWGGNFDTGAYFTTRDGINIPRNTQYPILAFSSNTKDLRKFVNRVRKEEVMSMFYIREMIISSDDVEIQGMLSVKNEAEVEYIGCGIFGNNDLVKALTKNFKLW